MTDSGSIQLPACPHRVIAVTAVRPTPAARKLPEVGVIAMRKMLHTS